MATVKKRATIKDVAAEAGVSYQTVSRVINDKSNVTKETRRKVWEVIRKLNYRPNLAARSLPRHRSHIIGLIIPYETDYFFRDPNLLLQISGIDAEANAHGYNLLLSTAGNASSGLAAYERFVQNQVADGAIAIETACSQEGAALLLQHAYPYVSVGHDLSSPKAYHVHSDNFAGGSQATKYLLEKGHERIGIINGPPIGAVSGLQALLQGHKQALAEANMSFDATLMVSGDYTRLSGERAAQKLLNLTNPPTAIFALNDRMALGAIRTLQAAGLRIPEDVAVVGFDDIPAASDFNPALTTVRQPSKKIGQTVAQLLFKLIEGEPVETNEVVLPVELIVRQSA